MNYNFDKKRGFLKIVKLDRNASLKNELNVSDDAYYPFDYRLVDTIAKDLNLRRNKVNMKIGFYERIFKLFELHDINEEEIPLLLNEWFDVTYYDVLTDKDNFQRKVTKEMIDFLALNFGVDKQWLYGNSVNLYKEEYGFYKNVKNFGNYIGEKKHKIENFYILTESIPDRKKDEKNDSNYIYIVVQYLKFNYPETDKNVYSYELFHESCRWGYWKCRYNFKSFLLYLHKYHKVGLPFYRGYAIPDISKIIYKFNKGEIDFEELITNRQIWYPEDYILTDKQSVQAKETDELEKILKEINQDKWSWP